MKIDLTSSIFKFPVSGPFPVKLNVDDKGTFIPIGEDLNDITKRSSMDIRSWAATLKFVVFIQEEQKYTAYSKKPLS